MYSKYDPQYDSFDSRAEQTRQIEESEDRVRTFEAMSEDEQENVIQAERLAFLAAERTVRRAPVTMNVALIGNGLYVRVGKRVA